MYVPNNILNRLLVRAVNYGEDYYSKIVPVESRVILTESFQTKNSKQERSYPRL